MKELKPDQLYHKCLLNGPPFESTDDLEVIEGVIEQERAIRAINLGLKIHRRNYNVYVAGPSGTGKTSIVRSILKKVSTEMPVPEDWCFVNNFKKTDAPVVISLPPGKGNLLKKEMENVINSLKVEMPKAFHAKDHQEKIQKILNRSLDLENEYFLDLNRKSMDIGFSIKSTKSGIVTIPMVENRPIGNKEYAELDEKSRRDIEKKREKLDPIISEFLERTREVEITAHREIQDLQKKLGKFVLSKYIKDIRKEFAEYKQVNDYIDSAENDILDNLSKFLPDESDPDKAQKILRYNYPEYTVNVIVDNSELKGAPVIFEHIPSYYNLVGKIEKRVEQGIYFTDFTMIKAGSLARANGGFLVLDVRDLLMQPFAWEHLKNVLKNRQLIIEDIGEHYSFLPTSGLKPDPIPVKCKVILIGNSSLYHLLYRVDEDFQKIFQIKADFDDEILRNDNTVMEYARFIATTVKNDGLKPVDRDGVAAIAEYGSRLVESKDKMTLKFNDICNIIIEANQCAVEDGSKFISRKHIKTAVEEREYRNRLIADKIFEEILENDIMIDTDGVKIGTINGLAVYSYGDMIFGKPSRITATTFQGKAGIINVEREARLSGNIYNKAVLIISGYLGAHYAQEKPLSLSVSLCFEQSYSSIDGDSASAAELLAILSSLADIPIKQGIAVTGSVNQSGEIQPIGGVNFKVEGFFRLCKDRGFNGKQGVIIPVQNVKNLMLSTEVIEAVKEKKFHIYPVATIDEGIEVLTGVRAGKKGKNGKFPADSVHGKAMAKLLKFSEKSEEEKSKKKK